MRTQPYRLPSRVDYRPRTSLAALTLKATLRDSIARAKDTSTQPGRQSRANDIVRGRPFDLLAVDHCIDDLIAAGASRDAILGIGYGVVRMIEQRLPPLELTLAEAQLQETIADGKLDEAQFEVAHAPTCPGAVARLRDRMSQYGIALLNLARVVR